MAGIEQNESEILQEILSCGGTGNEEEIVHIIQDNEVESGGESGGPSMHDNEDEINNSGVSST